MRAIAVLLALVLPAVAGCIQGEKLDEGTTASTASVQEPLVVVDPLVADPNATLDADVPLWQVGNAWQFEGYSDGPANPCTLVVISDSGPYQLVPTCETSAVEDAVFDISFIGAIRQDDLAGAQQGTPVKFFDFPLTDGKTWTARWDGLDITLTATAVPSLMAPGAGAAPGFTIVGTTSEGEDFVKYDFAPQIKWWTSLEFAQGYGIRIKGFQESYTGPYLLATANVLVDATALAPGTFATGTPFTVAEGQTWVGILFAGHAEGYTLAANVVDPDGSIAYSETASAEGGPFWSWVTVPATPGQWLASLTGLHNPDPGEFHLKVSEVKLEAFDLA